MSNRIDKPMLSPKQLIGKMRDEKGITFDYVSESEAESYLTDINNYLRVAAYRQNYQKYRKGKNKGKYIDLDFAYLQELSTIDMHLRFLLDRMCSDVEHALKVQLIRDIGVDKNEDGYTIVEKYINHNPQLIDKLNRMVASPFTGDLLDKYFTVQQTPTQGKPFRKEITAWNDCPVWVFCEFLSFGDTINFYEFYHSTCATNNNTIFSRSILNLVRNLRNAAAHNNCILANLNHGTSRAPKEIKIAVQSIPSISKTQAEKKLSCRPMLELVALFFMYNQVVTEKVKQNRIAEINDLFSSRMLKNKDYFKKNELITTNYEFVCKVIDGFFK